MAQKKLPPSAEGKRPLIEVGHAALSVRRQCALLGLSRSSLYYAPAEETAENLRLLRRLDEQYTACPFYGSRRMTAWLLAQGETVNRKRVQRLLRLMGLEALYPKPRLSVAGRGHRIYPYLLRGVSIERVDQVWSTDITYVPGRRGSCTWRRSSTGTAGTSWPGGCRIPWSVAGQTPKSSSALNLS